MTVRDHDLAWTYAIAIAIVLLIVATAIWYDENDEED